MEYMTVKEAAEKWGISERLAQRYCTEGRILGAAKFSGSWAIPQDAEKPTDPRKEKQRPEKEGQAPAGGFRKMPMPLMNTAFRPGCAMEAVENIEDEEIREVALLEYYYFSGQAQKASEIAEKYLDNESIALRLSAAWMFAYANLALDRIQYAKKALEHVNKTLASVDENTTPEDSALTVLVSTGAAVLLHLPVEAEISKLKQFIHLMPPGLRLFALYIQAHHAYLNRNYGTSIGIVETALMLQGETYPIPTIYLHLVATMDYMSLRQPELARKHLLEAWELARPDDLIEAFGEHHGLLGGMLEAVIKKEWPQEFRRIIAITYSFSAGWRKVHNPVTGHDVADDLTTTEFTVAMLAARGWLNKEIGAHLGVSANTVKQHVSVALQKLGITQRKELAKFMLK